MGAIALTSSNHLNRFIRQTDPQKLSNKKNYYAAKLKGMILNKGSLLPK